MRTLAEALAGIRRAPLLTGMAAVMIGLAFYTLGVFGLVAHNLQEALKNAEGGVEVAIFLRDDAQSHEIDDARRALAELSSVSGVAFVSKEQALARARRDFPDFEEVFGSLGAVNPLPRSLEVSIEHDGDATEAAELVRATALQFPFVEDAEYGSDWMEHLARIRRIAALVAAGMGTISAAVAGLITASALRIVIFARREEIYIMRLVGARDRYIRFPFLLEGAMMGLAGGLMASALTWGSHVLTTRLVFPLEWIEPAWMGAGILAATAYGLLSSLFAVRGRLEARGS